MIKLPYHIVIIDDVEAVVEILYEYVEGLYGSKVRVSKFSKVEDFHLMAKNDPADILITDINMPGQTGDMLLRKLVKEQQGTQVVIMTGEITFTNVINAFRDGATSLLKKPFAEEDVKSSLDLCLFKLDHWKDMLDDFRRGE